MSFEIKRLVLDTNVVLSAILWGGNPTEYFDLAKKERIQLFTSEFLLQELATVLKSKFYWKAKDLTEVKDFYQSLSQLVPPQPAIQLIKRKDSDNRVLECAVGARAHYIITGDKKDLLPLKKYKGISIVSPIVGLAKLEKYFLSSHP